MWASQVIVDCRGWRERLVSVESQARSGLKVSGASKEFVVKLAFKASTERKGLPVRLARGESPVHKVHPEISDQWGRLALRVSRGR